MGTDTIAVREARTGLVYRSAAALTGSTNYGHAIASGIRSAAGVSYVTGTHTMKVGMTFARGDFLTNDSVNQELAYNFRDGLPISLVQFAIPSDRTNKLSSDLGLYVQDQWTMKNLTISSGLRFDYLDLESLEADLGAGRWVPARHFDGELLARWKDISPRFGRRVRSLGRRQDCPEGECWQIYRWPGRGASGNRGQQPGHAFCPERDEKLDRHQWEFYSRLRFNESVVPSRGGYMRPDQQPEFRSEQSECHHILNRPS